MQPWYNHHIHFTDQSQDLLLVVSHISAIENEICRKANKSGKMVKPVAKSYIPEKY